VTGGPGQDDRVAFRPGVIRRIPRATLAARFGFGAGVSLLAGVVTVIAGPRIGGVFLAFPAILLAALTLVAKEDGPRQARDDARGATFGTLGMIVFAVVVAVGAGHLRLWLVLVAASAAWVVAGVGGYLLARGLGRGADEPSADPSRTDRSSR
jgi:uncharacterized membrane protein (GlpM family)